MRENRLSGSEGGATLIPSSLPLSFILSLRDKGLLRPKASPTPRTRGAIQSQRSARYLQHSIAPSLHHSACRTRGRGRERSACSPCRTVVHMYQYPQPTTNLTLKSNAFRPGSG